MSDFVPVELAVELKEKGFREECYGYYTKNGNFFNICPQDINDSEYRIPSPTISQVLKWLREEKRWVIVVRLYSTNGWYWFVQDEKGELKSSHLVSCDDCFATYELAALAGIEYVIDNLI